MITEENINISLLPNHLTVVEGLLGVEGVVAVLEGGGHRLGDVRGAVPVLVPKLDTKSTISKFTFSLETVFLPKYFILQT